MRQSAVLEMFKERKYNQESQYTA